MKQLVIDTDYVLRSDGKLLHEGRFVTVSPYGTTFYRGKTVGIARLVALHFLPNPNPTTHTHVIRVDMDKTNNDVSNLRWATPTEARTYGLVKYKPLTSDQVTKVKQVYGTYYRGNRITQLDLAEAYGTSVQNIRKALRS